jgi:hypothetical protein
MPLRAPTGDRSGFILWGIAWFFPKMLEIPLLRR